MGSQIIDNLELQQSLSWLGTNEGLVLPYGIRAGTHNGVQHGVQTPAANQNTWDAYQWNPPQYHSEFFDEPDPDASPKLTMECSMACKHRPPIRTLGTHTNGIRRNIIQSFLTNPTPTLLRNSQWSAAWRANTGRQSEHLGRIPMESAAISFRVF